MKKIITTLAFTLSICALAQAQSSTMGCTTAKPTPDAKLLSTSIEGDYKVSNWLVKETTPDQNNEFSVKYQINTSRMISSYDNNSKELTGLRNFINEAMEDKMKKITRIQVTGFASPDGPTVLNQKLSTARADDCCSYINKEFDFDGIKCTPKGVALGWSNVVDGVKQSSIPQKSEVLALVMSKQTNSDIEAKLQAMPASWSYMKSNILPPLRCVEIEVFYNAWRQMQTRTPIVEEVVEQIVVQNNYYLVAPSDNTNIMAFENCSLPLDYNDTKSKFKFKDKKHREKMKEELRNQYTGERGRTRRVLILR